MYKAVIGFTCGSHTFKAGDDVPENLPHNADRLNRGLIKEEKVIKPEVVKDELQSSDSKRKSKNKAKSKKQSNK